MDYGINTALGAFSNEAKPLCLQIWTKTKIQDFGGLLGEPVQSISACGEEIGVTESFTYLGSAVHASGLSDREVSRQIGLAAEGMNSVNKTIWRFLLYGSETWTLSSALESCLNTFYNKSLRRIKGYRWQDHVSNRRLHCETGMRPATYIIWDCQLRLYGHLAHFPVDDPAHQVVSVRHSPAWRRPMERPRKSWLRQLNQTCREELEMGRGLTWRLAMRDPRGWK
ncbi:uncharacterized protein [Penaeus vannamei]|uniref:uncharacterized protein n=1 Tax=Penaeus vannamei TaxID=6689 RepID=UPI00387F6D25